MYLKYSIIQYKQDSTESSVFILRMNLTQDKLKDKYVTCNKNLDLLFDVTSELKYNLL